MAGLASLFGLSSGNENEEGKPVSRKPKYTRFTQQELPACKPLLTPSWVITTFFVVGVVFIPLGAVALAASNSVVEAVLRYDDACLPGLSEAERDAVIENQLVTAVPACNLTLTIPSKMSPPIYVYYQLTNFYQNHRRYVNSRDDTQLRGGSVSDSSLESACSPEAFLEGNKSLPINPCGLIAWSYFNDSYSLDVGGSALTVIETDISWQSDRAVKFGTQYPQNFNTVPELRGGGTLAPNVSLDKDEHLIVWMRTAALPTFRKLWGRIETTLAAGSTISLNVDNYYNSYKYRGKKSVVLSTASWLGGKNDFLGIAYLTVGGLCIFLALLFLALHLISPRKLGDTSYLSWNRKSQGSGR